MHTLTDEKKSFYYTIENITDDITIYNYWVLKTNVFKIEPVI